MYPNQYQLEAMRTCPAFDGIDPLINAIPETQKRCMITHGTLLISSEAGEVAGLVQKIFQGHELDESHLVRELGDILWGVSEIATALDVSLHMIMETNIDKLRARYPRGFDPQNSMIRDPEDV